MPFFNRLRLRFFPETREPPKPPELPEAPSISPHQISDIGILFREFAQAESRLQRLEANAYNLRREIDFRCEELRQTEQAVKALKSALALLEDEGSGEALELTLATTLEAEMSNLIPLNTSQGGRPDGQVGHA